MIQQSNLSKILTILLSIAISSIWFIFDYKFAPKTSFYFILGIKILLLLGIFFQLFFIKWSFNYTINYIILWIIFTEVFINQSSYSKLFVTLIGSNLLLIFFLPFYFQMYSKLMIFIKTYMLFIFVTVICIGFFQFFYGKPIFDFYRFHDTSTIYNIENMRFTGLIYPDTTVAADALGIFGIYFIIKNRLETKNKIFSTIAYLLAFLAIAITLTRTSWVAMIFSLIASAPIIRFINRKKNFQQSKLNITRIIVTLFALLGIIQILSFVFENIILPSELDRLSSEATFNYRIERYSLFLKNSYKIILIGFGIIQDPAISLQQIIGQFRWGTVHNQIFEFAIAFGFLFTFFIYFRMIKAMSILFKYSQTKFKNDSAIFAIFLIFSQLFVFINEMGASNNYYFSILLLTISEITIKNIHDSGLVQRNDQQKQIISLLS